MRLAYFTHSLRSDWNNGNAHFLRGLLREMTRLGHDVHVFEPEEGWSYQNLVEEPLGAESLRQSASIYEELSITTYHHPDWEQSLEGFDVVIFHEWNPPELARTLAGLRAQLGFKLLFHDTHHRASSTPEQIRDYSIDQFDGVVAFGEALRAIYRNQFGIKRVWTLHEAADIEVFRPLPIPGKQQDVVWIGNWGDDERTQEIHDYFLSPAQQLLHHSFAIYGVRYPAQGLEALGAAGVEYRGYLPNLDAPAAYARSQITVHIPRQQYVGAMRGIPTIRVFEALACGIPLISAPWDDCEHLFRVGDYLQVRNTSEMTSALQRLLEDPAAAEDQSRQGLETLRARHTCRQRAEELSAICEEVLR